MISTRRHTETLAAAVRLGYVAIAVAVVAADVAATAADGYNCDHLSPLHLAHSDRGVSGFCYCPFD